MRFPHPLTLLVICVLVAAGLTYALPAGQFERRLDDATGRNVVVAGTYHRVDPAPVSAFQAIVAIPKGMVDAGGVIFYVFLVGGAFAVVERTGAPTRLVQNLVTRLQGNETLIIPITCLAFGLGGGLIQMQEELIAFVPMLLLLTRRLGFQPLVAVAVSLGAAAIAAAFSPVNPFQVVIAQKVAEVEPQSGLWFRMAVLAPAIAVWIWGTMRYAKRTGETGKTGNWIEEEGLGDLTTATAMPVQTASPVSPVAPVSKARDNAILLIVLVTFALFVYGARRLGWDFPEFAALFFLMGVLAGLLGRLGIGGTADGLVEGFRGIAYAALLIGFARGIFVVLDQGQIVDSIVQGIFTPIAKLPVALSAIGMMVLQGLVHVPVPSTSGQAVLTMPVLVPLSDLLGMARQVTVLSYQYGAGICELLTPTNGALMAMLAACGVRYDEWIRFVVRLLLPIIGIAIVGLLVAIGTGLR